MSAQKSSDRNRHAGSREKDFTGGRGHTDGNREMAIAKIENKRVYLDVEAIKTIILAVRTPQPKNKTGILSKIANWAAGLRGFVLNFGIILIIGSIFYISFSEITNSVLVVQPFEVPKYLLEKGHTGKVFSNRLMDKIKTIAREAKTNVAQKEFVGIWAKEKLKIEMPGTGLSLANLNLLAKEAIGIPTQGITGEVTLLDKESGKIEITVRPSGYPSKSFKGMESNFEEILHNSAQYVVRSFQPYLLASYQYSMNTDEYLESCLHTIAYTIKNMPAEDDAYAYNLWGLLIGKKIEKNKESKNTLETELKELDRSDTEKRKKILVAFRGISKEIRDLQNERIEKFKRAIELKEDHPHAYSNLAPLLANKAYKIESTVEVMVRDHSENNLQRTEKYEKLIEARKKFTADRINEYTAEKDKLFSEANIAFMNAAKCDAENVDNFINWGQLLLRLNRKSESEKNYKRALMLEVNPNERADLLIVIGKAYLHNGDIDNAIIAIEEAKKLTKNSDKDFDDDAMFNYLYFRALKKKGKYKEARKKLNAAIALDEKNIGYYFARDNLEILMTPDILKLEERLNGYQKKELNGYQNYEIDKKIELLNGLAWYYVTHPDSEKRQGEIGLSYAEEAVTLAKSIQHPMLPSCLDTLAAACAENKNFSKAIKNEKEAIEIAKLLKNNKNPYHRKYIELINKAERLLQDAYYKRKSYIIFQEERQMEEEFALLESMGIEIW